ncbi:C39 family peptidase [Candidatus Pacearchaeota archaeon]|nr:C39 family peptidase [Candidatus Pacearchaeota archaeon]
MANKSFIKHKLNLFKQTQGYCGPTSLKIVLDYFGINLSEKKIAELAKSSRKHGTTPENILKVLKNHGFKNAKIKTNSSIKELELEIKKAPVIVNWFYDFCGHYSVAIGYTKKSLILAEPLEGKIKYLDKFDFLVSWFDYKGDVPKSSGDFIIRTMIILGKKG